MSKRKATMSGDNEVANQFNSKRRRTSRNDGLEGVLENGKKGLYRALRVSRGFERQKLGRRQKTAKDQNESAESVRLANEVTALKSLDLLAIGELHLYKALLKSKPISTAPSFPAWIAKQIKKQPPIQDHASANVAARLFNSNPVKAALEIVLGSVHNVLDLPADDVPRRKKRLRAADYKIKVRDEGLEKTHPKRDAHDQGTSENLIPQQQHHQAPVSDEDVNISEGESEEYNAYDARLANPSDSEGEASSAIESDNETAESQGLPIDKSVLERDTQSPSLSPSISPSPSPPKIRAFTQSKPLKPTKSTTFLPTLSGGYWSGSEPSNDEAGTEPEDSTVLKPRKNRRGQQERRAIWEKKFGAKAKHLSNQVPDSSKAARDKGWDPKRGASDGNAGRGRGRGRGGRMNGGEKGGGGVPVRSGANSDPVNGAKERGRAGNSNAKKKADEGPLHPSWEAKKKAKEKAGNTSAVFQGKKVVFD